MSGVKKANVISKIVRLKQVVTRWKSKSSSFHSSDDDSDDSAAPNSRTPSGSVAVYVGEERLRFVIPTRFLNLPVFVALLNQAGEEFGYPATGGIKLPCNAVFFTSILRLLENDEEKYRALGLDDFVRMLSDFKSYDQSSCKESSSPAKACRAVAPLMQNTRV